MRVLISVLHDGTDLATDAEAEAIDAFNARLEAEGRRVLAVGLAAPATARVVDARGAGRPVVTDGPFAETTEHVVGLWVLDADNEDHAAQLAAEGSRACHRRVELRAVL
jgi:hypothetical protein